jgi:hypothetical protein
MRAPLLLVLATAATAGLAGTASAQFSHFGGTAYQPVVPVSAFARPAAWFDPSRLQISTEISVGSGFNQSGLGGLQVTRLSYQFGAPLAMRVSVGNAFGGGALQGGSFFLEGLDLSYRPFNSFLIQVHYQDVRSPLQYRSGYDPFLSRWR